MPPDASAAVALTLLQIETMRREIQASVLDTMMAVNQQFLDQQLKQDDFVVANEIARLIKDSLTMAGDIASELRKTVPPAAMVAPLAGENA